MDGILVVVLAVLSVFPSFAHAQSSTFYLEDTETQFSLNIANDGDAGDVFIYFTSPAYSWVGVGFGESMKDSLMFIMYPDRDGRDVTVSPRIANGPSEPSFARDVKLEILNGTGIHDDMFVLRAVCHYCRAWRGGSLNVLDTEYPMIYAFGPGQRLQSNDRNAALKRHVRYGRFTMDMAGATGKGEVPSPSTAPKGVVLKGGMTRDHDRKNLAHAVMGCLALFVFWPINVVVGGFFKRIKIHIGVSIFLMAFLVSAYALGIATSGQYNRSKTYTSPHQITAFISLFPILAISILPIRPIQNLSPHIAKLHTPFVSLSFTLLVLTGGLGLHLSSQSRPVILAYTAIALLVFCFCMLLQMCVKRRGSRYARSKRTHVNGDDERGLLGLKNMSHWGKGAWNKLAGEDSRSVSRASADRGEQGGHVRSESQNSGFGGGTMPGPQYLLNMHPGVPVNRW